MMLPLMVASSVKELGFTFCDALRRAVWGVLLACVYPPLLVSLLISFLGKFCLVTTGGKRCLKPVRCSEATPLRGTVSYEAPEATIFSPRSASGPTGQLRAFMVQFKVNFLSAHFATLFSC